jgi:hypothetical protein
LSEDEDIFWDNSEEDFSEDSEDSEDDEELEYEGENTDDEVKEIKSEDSEYEGEIIPPYRLGFALPALFTIIGEPTHHSKVVAFQTPASPIMEVIVDLHHDIMFFLVFVIAFVMYLLIAIIGSSQNKPQAKKIRGKRQTFEVEFKAARFTPFFVSSHNTLL